MILDLLARETPGESITLPLDQGWTRLDGGLLRPGPEGLEIPAGTAPSAATCAISLDFDTFDELRINMKVSAGTRCVVRWQGPVEPSIGDNPGRTIPIMADGAFHDYRVPLKFAEETPWTGRVDQLLIEPSDVAADCTIASVELLPRKSRLPRQVTLNGRTHDALPAAPQAWSVELPPAPTLDVALGLAARGWESLNTDGVRFLVRLSPPDGPVETVLDRVLSPVENIADRAWRRAAVDLGAHAGKRVRLEFSVDPVGNTAGDYAFWGNPMVYGRAPAPDGLAVPVVLISCDTMRADHLSCYGYSRPTSPNLDALAADAVLFENAFTSEVWTPTSHMTMFTGLFPKRHGLTRNINAPESVTMLAETMRGAGYATAGFTGHAWWFLPSRGFGRGFDTYDIPPSYRNVFETHALAYDWLEEHRFETPFLFVHNYDVHSRLDGDLPYDAQDDRFRRFSTALGAPPSFGRDAQPAKVATEFLAAANAGDLTPSAREIEYMNALYDDCVLKVDHGVGELLDCLRDLGLYDRALIMVVSDHGESLGEHGRYIHGDVYDYDMRVVMLVKFPGQRFAGQRASGLVQLADLFPTVLEVIGQTPPEGLDGRSLLAVLEGREPPVDQVFSKRVAWRAVRTPERKLIKETVKNVCSWFEVAADPGETIDLYPGRPGEVAGLLEQLETFFQPAPGGWHLALRKGQQDWSGAFSMQTSDRIVSARLEKGHYIESNETVGVSRELEGRITLTEGTPRDVLVVRTADPRAEVALTLSSEQPFRVLTEKGLAEPATTHRFVLNPGQPEYARAVEVPADSPDPVISAWFVPPLIQGHAAQELSEEAQNELRGLGYLN
jgi:arylsulfatase A-like enzyme